MRKTSVYSALYSKASACRTALHTSAVQRGSATCSRPHSISSVKLRLDPLSDSTSRGIFFASWHCPNVIMSSIDGTMSNQITWGLFPRSDVGQNQKAENGGSSMLFLLQRSWEKGGLRWPWWQGNSLWRMGGVFCGRGVGFG